tara:strand:+ start:1750 stop:2904 length:1155 start_codon:yes stop_codon:yes gene_type:complete
MSISPKLFLNHLLDNNVDFFTGVPDSLLKYLCLCIDNNTEIRDKHIIAANEGSAIALASGYYIGSNKIPLVYMQNSGLGNAINPLLSLTDPEVYSIPMIILIGWRGEPGVKDEPQHIKQGRVQLNLLESMELPYSVISSKNDNYKDIIDEGLKHIKDNLAPYVFVIKKNTFSKFDNNNKENINEKLILKRETVLQKIIENISDNSIIISTTGKTSREIFEIREQNNQSHENDFLTIGSMGHCSSLALGIAKANPDVNIYCIDGDGSMIMHMGSLSMVGQQMPKNFKHILINNFVHESVGGQNTASNIINFDLLSKSMNYKNYSFANNESTLIQMLNDFNQYSVGPSFFEIQVQPGSRSDLGRPTTTPEQNKLDLMSRIDELSKK